MKENGHQIRKIMKDREKQLIQPLEQRRKQFSNSLNALIENYDLEGASNNLLKRHPDKRMGRYIDISGDLDRELKQVRSRLDSESKRRRL